MRRAHNAETAQGRRGRGEAGATRGVGRVQDSATEVTAAGIARLAGVGRAAVSNWRRRHADFPKPVGGTETSPAFALAEIESWLRKQGKLAEVPLRERVWQQLVGHPEGPVAALVYAGCALLLIHERPTVWLDVSAGSDERMAAMLPGALEQVLVPRCGAVRGRGVHRGREGSAAAAVNTPNTHAARNTPNASSAVNTANTVNATAAPTTSPAPVNTASTHRTAPWHEHLLQRAGQHRGHPLV